MQIRFITPIAFKYKSVLKDEFKAGHLPSVIIDPMGSILTKKNCTLDHFQPHSQKGGSEIGNYLLMKDVNNWKKADLPAKDTIKAKGLIKYLTQFIDVITEKFNGNDYIRAITKNAEKQGIDLGTDFKEIVKNLKGK